MEFKKSIYNFVYDRNDEEIVIYNTFSKALVVLDKQEYELYENDKIVDGELLDTLVENGIFVKNKDDEKAFLKYFHFKTKFSNDTFFLTIAPTLDCNFACPYCYENRRHGSMSKEVQSAIIKYLEDQILNGVRCVDISWYGGEPLLYPDIVKFLSKEIASITEENKCILKMHMVTNGYLLNEEIVEMLDDVGISRVQITIDGNEEHHNARRPLTGGQGTYQRIVNNLKLFSEYPTEVLVRMNVDNENCKDYADLKALIREIGNPNIELYASPVEDINKDTVNEVSDFMTTEEFNHFIMDICDGNGSSNEDFAIMDDRYCFCTAETENCYVVDDKGDFYKCWDEVGREEYKCFNILNSEEVNYELIARYVADDPFSDEKCKDCIFLPLCYGGCKFQKAHLNKSVCGFTDEKLKRYLEATFFK